MQYDYSRLRDDIQALKNAHNGLECFSIGKSAEEREILCIKTGCGAKKLFLSGAYHGLESITAAFLVKFTKALAERSTDGEEYYGCDARALLNKLTLFIAPMINPDGVDIAINGINPANDLHKELLRDVGMCGFCGVWQANARGVDINHNFNARWKRVTEHPAPTKHGGPYPESEPETQAVINLCRREKFDAMIAFHSQGGEIYYDFNRQTAPRSLELARKMAKASGYKVRRPTGTASFGGCKDWFIQEFGKEGFTVEMGRGTNPLPLETLGEIYDENARLTLCLMEEM